MPPKTAMPRVPEDAELARLRDEVARLRELLGPSEESYVKLRLDLLSARDAVRGAQAELGQALGRQRALEAEVARQQRHRLWFKRQVTVRVRRHTARVPVVGRLVDRLSR